MTKLSTIFYRINQALRHQYDEIVKEPLPKRWIDLINHLNELEARRHSPGGSAPRSNNRQ